MDPAEAKKQIASLIEKYSKIAHEGKVDSYNESSTRKDFILPLFRALGWDIENSEEVSSEETISKKRVDFGFRLDGIPKFFLETKKLGEELEQHAFFEQAINYSWHKGCTYAILTNFRMLYILNAEWNTDKLIDSRITVFDYSDYISRFDELWLLSKDGFRENLLDKFAENRFKKRIKRAIDKQLLDDLVRFREMLSKDIVKNNQDRLLSEEDVEEIVQRIIDRLIFIRNAEDREYAPVMLLSKIRDWDDTRKGRLVEHIRQIYQTFDADYNSKLFASHACDVVIIDNEVLKTVIKGLYFTSDNVHKYDFSIIDADILGKIYEQYLGTILHKTQKRATLTESPNRRKEQGIYYTPTYVVDYIIKNTLGELLKSKDLDLEHVKILDPACGSGSFLIKAFDALNEHYQKSMHDAQSRLAKTGDYYSTKLNILVNNIFGVDLDKQAIEITQLNLLLRLAEKGHRLPLLQQNIKCGNSLIDDVEVDFKAITWNIAFKDIINDGGFDIIVGNPPYERILYIDNEKDYYSKNYVSAYGAYDLLILFLEKSISLLKNNGYLGFIVSNKFLVSDYGKNIRNYLLSNCKLVKIIDLADAQRIFPDALVSTVILILQKTKFNLQKNKSKENYDVGRFIADKNTSSFEDAKFEKVPINNLISNNGTINLRYTQKKDTIYAKIDSLQKFGDKGIFEIRTGIMGFEYWKMAPFIHNDKQDTTDIRILTNGHIDRYRFLFGKEINLYKKKYNMPYASIAKLPINENTKTLFRRKNKIIVRGVAKKLSAMLDREGQGMLVAVHSITVNNDYGPRFVLALMNSTFFDWIHKDRFYLGRIPEGSLKYPVSFLKALPLPKDVSVNDVQLIEKLVDKMLNLTDALSKIGDTVTDKQGEIELTIKNLNNEIDAMIYKIYHINDEERIFIEKEIMSYSKFTHFNCIDS
jgi:predicted type IV restriction endonuclease/methylase of polypeptide subunit release factors